MSWAVTLGVLLSAAAERAGVSERKLNDPFLYLIVPAIEITEQAIKIFQTFQDSRAGGRIGLYPLRVERF
jgi:hypothetical protein